MLAVRRAALERFGEAAIRAARRMATLEEVLVPLYLHHRYQMEAAAKVLGGQEYTYALRGDGARAARARRRPRAAGGAGGAAADARTRRSWRCRARARAHPPAAVRLRRTASCSRATPGWTFDAVSPAVSAADMTFALLFDPQRAARLVEQHALDRSLPGLEQVLDAIDAATFAVTTNNAYEVEISRAVQRVYVDRLIRLAGTAEMPQVRAIAAQRLRQRARDQGDAHAQLIADDIKRFLERPVQPAQLIDAPQPPPGAPIGEPALDWLRRAEPLCVPI